MKLRLPNKLLAAIAAAASALTFATLATGSAAYGDATYTDFSALFLDDDNGVYYSGQGQFNIESEVNTTLVLTLNMEKMYSWLNLDGTNHDYVGSTNLVSWNYCNEDGSQTYTWGVNDITSKKASYSGAPAIVASSAGNPVGNALLTYDYLNNLADSNHELTLTFTSGAQGVSIYNGGNLLASATGIGNSNAAVTTGFSINTNYVSSVTLQTASSLDTNSIILPADASVPFSKTRQESVGRIVFMGDSITHGVYDATWRWQMFKTFVDNGVEFEIDGPMTGHNDHAQANPDYIEGSASYAGVAFENEHYAMSSGRTNNMITADMRYNMTVDQLGNNYNVNTGVILIGTNDILSDTGSGSGIGYSNYQAQYVKLLGGTVTYSADKNVNATWTWTHGENDGWGNMGTILSEMNLDADDTFYVMSIPTWGVHSNHTNTTDHAAVAAYNGLLEQWVKAYSDTHAGTIKYVDVNKGMVDLTAPTAFFGNKSFFNNGSDGLHPSTQGSLIMAGNLAQAMGIGGRTAGLNRSGVTVGGALNIADGWAQDAETTRNLSNGDSLTIAAGLFNKAGGYTVDFNAVFGNGSEDGWLDANKDSGYGANQKVTNFSALTNFLAITVGDGENCGTLKLAEGYITWAGSNGDQVLYCVDNSKNDATLRVAYHSGSVNPGDNVTPGYYVWLDDMLIGHGLEAMHGSDVVNGITLGLTSAEGATGAVSNLAWADKAYAPTVGEGVMYNAEHAYLTTMLNDKPNRDNTSAAGLGIDFIGAATTTGSSAAASGSGVVKTVLTCASGYYGAVNGAANTHSGSVTFKVASDTAGNAFGVVNGSVNADGTNSKGDVNAVFQGAAGTPISIGSASYDSGAITGSFLGAFSGNIAGDLNVEVSHATMGGNIWMGVVKGNNTIGGNTKLIVNTGSTINGSVYGGSLSNGTISGNSVIEINGGTVNGDIVGAGKAGTINGYTAITITGGVITGAVNAGTTGTAVINGADANGAKSSVTVIGTDARIGGAISAEHVTLKDISNDKDGYTGGMDYHNGGINAAKELTLDHYTVDRMASAVTTEKVTLKNHSATTISNLTLTACELVAEEGSSLTLDGVLTLGNTATYSGNIIVTDGLTFSMSATDSAAIMDGKSYSYHGTSGYLSGTALLMKAANDSQIGSLTVYNPATYQGAGALKGAEFTYDRASGNLYATLSETASGAFFVNSGDSIEYSKTADSGIYNASEIILDGGTLTLTTSLKRGVTVSAGENGGSLILDSGKAYNATANLPEGVTVEVKKGSTLDFSSVANKEHAAFDLSSVVSGAGTVAVAFENSGNHNSYVKTADTFTGSLDISGHLHLASQLSNATGVNTYYLHDGEAWNETNNLIVSKDIRFGGTYKLLGNNLKLSGKLSSTEDANLLITNNVTIANSGSDAISKVTVSGAVTLTLQEASQTPGATLFTGDIHIGSGAKLTLEPGNNAERTYDEAAKFQGGIRLEGTAASTATVYNYSKSYSVEGGVHLGSGAYGTMEFQDYGSYFIKGLSGTNANLTLQRNAGGGGAWATNVSLMNLQDGEFSGTLKLKAARAFMAAVVYGSPTALADTAVAFEGSATTQLAFADKASDIEIQQNRQFNFNNCTFGNGTVGGLNRISGTAAVYADALTINAAAGADYTYSGALNINSLIKEGAGVQTIASDIGDIAVTVKEGTLNLAGGATISQALVNNASLGLGGTVNVTMDGIDKAVTQGVYGLNKDNLSASNDGYAWNGTAATGYNIVSGNAATAMNNLSWQLNGTAVSDASVVLFDGNTLSVESGSLGTTYYLNTVDGTYDYTEDDTTTTGFVINGRGATLQMDRDTSALTDTPRIQVNADSHIKIGENGSVNKSDVSVKDGASVSLSGNGAYVVQVNTTNNSDIALGAGVSLSAQDWAGRVVLTNNNGAGTTWGVESFTAAALNALAPTANSWLELKDFKGYFNNANETFNSNIILNGANALYISNGWNKDYTFTGTIKGDGTFTEGYQGNTIIFKGDISGWTGAFVKSNTAGTAYATTVKFGEKAHTVNAAISYKGLDLNLEALTDVTFNNAVSAKKLTAAGHTITLGSTETTHGSLTLNGDSSIGKLVLGAETTATIGGTLALGSTISNAGALTLNGSVTVGTDINAFEVYDGHVPTYSDGVNGFLNSTDGAMFYLVKNSDEGTTTLGDSFSFTGGTANRLESGDVVFSLTSSPATDIYYVNSKTVTGLKTDANTYSVANGATFEVTGSQATGKTVILHEGATLASAAQSGFGAQQLQNLYVKGDATIDTTKGDIGVIARDHAATNVDLNGHTLTVKGGKNFYIAHADFSGGSIHLEGANAQLQKSSNIILDTVTSSAATTANKLTIDNSSTVEVLGTTTVRDLAIGNGSTAIFDDKVTVTNSRISVSGNNTSVTMKKGLSFTGSDGNKNYALVLSNNSTVTLCGVSDLSGKKIGHGAGSTLIFASDAVVDAQWIYNSTNRDSDGTVKLEKGAQVTLTDVMYTAGLQNSGTLTVGGLLEATNATMTGANAKLSVAGGNSVIDNLTMAGGAITYSGNGTMNATLVAGAHEGTFTRTGGTFNVNVNKESSFSGTATGVAIKVAAGGNLTFNGQASGAAVSLADSGIATIKGQSVNGSYSVAGSGNLAVDAAVNGASLAVTGSGSATFTNEATALTDITVDQTAQLAFNTGHTVTANTLKLANGGANTAEVGISVAGNTTLEITGSGDSVVFAAHGERIDIEAGSALKIDSKGLTVESIDGETDAAFYTPVAHASNGFYTYRHNSYGFTVENAKLTLNNGASATTLNNVLKNTDVVNEGTGKLTIDQTSTKAGEQNTLHALYAKNGAIELQDANTSAESLKSIKAEGGDVTLLNLGDETQLSLSDLLIADGATVGAYKGASVDENQVASLTVSGTLTTETDSALNANLTLANGSTLVSNGALTMGCTLTLGNNLTLDTKSEAYKTLYSLTESGSAVTLFDSVEGLTLGSDELNAALNLNGYVQASDVFGNIADGPMNKYLLNYDDGAVTLSLNVVPEPATATLSLLALAGLAARRRRH